MKLYDHYSKFKGFIWRSHWTTVSWILLIIGIAVGLLLTAQWRTKPTRASDPVISYALLENTQKNLVSEKEELRTQIKELQDKISKEENSLKQYQTSKKAVEQVEEYEMKIGLKEITGSGITIIMDDSRKTNPTIDSITHAADLRDIVNLLWGSGAQAISINGERVVFTTSIDCIVNTILINTTKTSPPFIIKAIGDLNKLEGAINNKDNLKDLYKRIKNEGIIFSVQRSDSLTITAFQGSFNINQAKKTN